MVVSAKMPFIVFPVVTKNDAYRTLSLGQSTNRCKVETKGFLKRFSARNSFSLKNTAKTLYNEFPDNEICGGSEDNYYNENCMVMANLSFSN